MLTSLFVPVGLIIYGWTADKHVFWLVPDIGIGIFAFGTITPTCSSLLVCARADKLLIFCRPLYTGTIGGFLTVSTYLVDNYTIYAASAVGAAASLRSLAGFGFPLFASMDLLFPLSVSIFADCIYQ